MSLAALRSLFTSCVAPADAKETEPLHQQSRAHLGPVVREFFQAGQGLRHELNERDLGILRTSPDLVRTSYPGRRLAHRARTPSTGTPLDIVAVPHREAAMSRRHAGERVHVLAVHGGVPEPCELLALVKRLDQIQDLKGCGNLYSRISPRCPDSLAAACSAAMAIHDKVRDAMPSLSRDDGEIVREACQRLPMDVRSYLRAEEMAALLAFSFHCKVQYLSPKLDSATVRRPRPSPPDDGRAHVHWGQLTGTRSSPPR